MLARPIEPWAIFVFVFAIVGAALGFQLWTGRQAVRDTEVARLQDASRYVSENISRQLRGLNEALTRLASDYRTTALTASGEDVSRQLSLLSSAVQSVRGIAIYDGNGNAVASSQSDEVGRDFFAGDFFSEIRKDPRPEVLYLSQRGAIEDRPIALYLSRAIFNSDGQFSGIVSANLDDEFFAFVVRAGLFASDMRATLAYPDGEIFVTVPAIKGLRRVNVSTPGSAFEMHVQGKEMQTVFEGVVAVTGLERLLVLNSIRPANVGLIYDIIFSVSRDRSVVYAPWYRQVRLYGISYLVVVVTAAILLALERRRRRASRAKEEIAQAALQLGAARLELALDGAQLGLWELHADAQQLHLDARGAQMLGYGPQQLVRPAPDWTETLHPADQKSNTALFAAHLSGATTVYENEFRVLLPGGGYIWLFSRGKVTERATSGAPLRLIGTFMDITARKHASLELEELNAALAELSYKDALTGLGNRRMFDDTLAAEWSRHARQKISLALLMIDIDYFKLFNDNRGHPDGDECLRQVAGLLKETLWRTHERALRYGGEEFAILLLETSLEGALSVAERIMEALEVAQIAHGFSPIGPFVTVSIGAAALVPSADQGMSTLTQAADMSLYRAKGQGRSRVAVADGASLES